MAEVAKSARSIDYLLRSIWHGIEYRGKDRLGRFMKKVRTTALTEDILISHQEVALSVDAPISTDATLSFKVAAAASQIGLPLSMETSALIGQKAPPLSTPWPRIARENFIAFIGAGPSMISVWEGFEQEGVIASWFPEWSKVSSLPQRNLLHRHTVDRHMVETLVHASALTRKVHRPDLLLLRHSFMTLVKAQRTIIRLGALRSSFRLRLAWALILPIKRP